MKFNRFCGATQVRADLKVRELNGRNGSGPFSRVADLPITLRSCNLNYRAGDTRENPDTANCGPARAFGQSSCFAYKASGWCLAFRGGQLMIGIADERLRL